MILRILQAHSVSVGEQEDCGGERGTIAEVGREKTPEEKTPVNKVAEVVTVSHHILNTSSRSEYVTTF